MPLVQVDTQIYNALKPIPDWDPVKKLEGFETVQRARQRRRELIQSLYCGREKCLELAETLAKCRSYARCRSAVCPVCGRHFRRRFAGRVAQLVANDSAEWSALSLVSPDDKTSLGRLYDFEPRFAKDRIRKQLSRGLLANVPAIGGIDFAVLVSEKSLPLWVPHYYILFRAPRITCKEALKPYFESDLDILRPVRARKVNKTEILKPATYMLKNRFNIRFSTTDAEGTACTVKRPLADDHWRELAPLLHDWGFVARIFQRNV